MDMTIAQIKKNIRRLPTKKLKTYESAYAQGQIYKFARDTAISELKRRKIDI
jgi:hypothetical protein